MGTRIGINGFGRMGRLALRAAWDWPELEIVHINEVNAPPETGAHLLEYDTVHGRWARAIRAEAGSITIDGEQVSWSSHSRPADVPWRDGGVDIVVECSGAFRTPALLEGHFEAGARKVLVSAPVKEGALNVVVGCNDHAYDPSKHDIVTAASCTTNCIAPIVRVFQETNPIRHGLVTTIHDVTNTQVIVDAPHKDLRRARSALNSLIPTTTGSATATTLIYPELQGRLNGLAVRVPLLNASLVDCVFEVENETTPEVVNGLLKQYAGDRLKGILGFEEKPLVSADFLNDPRSGVVDGPGTMVTDRTLVKVLAWYDNEIGYVHRMMELARRIAAALPG